MAGRGRATGCVCRGVLIFIFAGIRGESLSVMRWRARVLPNSAQIRWLRLAAPRPLSRRRCFNSQAYSSKEMYRAFGMPAAS